MKFRNAIAIVAASTLVAGCPEESTGAAAVPDAPAATDVEADPDAALLEGIDLSGDEAAESINEENADAEFEKLRQEIEGG